MTWTWIDLGWGLVFGLLLLAVVIDRHRRKKQAAKKTIKDIALAPNDWALLRALANKQRTTQSNLIANILKQYLNNIH